MTDAWPSACGRTGANRSHSAIVGTVSSFGGAALAPALDVVVGRVWHGGGMDKCEALGCANPVTQTVEHLNYADVGREVSQVCDEHHLVLVQRDVAKWMLPLMEEQRTAEANADVLKQALIAGASDPTRLRDRLRSGEFDAHLAMVDRHAHGWHRIAEAVEGLPDPEIQRAAAHAEQTAAVYDALLQVLLPLRS